MRIFVTIFGVLTMALTTAGAAEPVLDKGNLRPGDELIIPHIYSGRPDGQLKGDDIISVRLVQFQNLSLVGVSFDKKTYYYVSFYKPSGKTNPKQLVYLVDAASFVSDTDLVMDSNKVESMLDPSFSMAQQVVGSCDQTTCRVAFRGNKLAAFQSRPEKTTSDETISLSWRRENSGYRVYVDRWNNLLSPALQIKYQNGSKIEATLSPEN